MSPSRAGPMDSVSKLPEATAGLGRVARRLLPYLQRERALGAAASAMLLAEVALRLVEPWPLKMVFDRVIPGSNAEPLRLPIAGQLDGTELIAAAAIAVVLVAALRALASYVSTVGFALVGNRALTAVRGDLYRHLQALSLSFHDRARSGDLTLRVVSDVGLLKDVAVTALLPLFAHTFVLAGMIAVMAWMEWRLALLAMLVLPLFWIRTTSLSRRIHQAARAQRRREASLAATTAEALGAMRIVQALSLEGVFDESFAAHNKRSLKEGVKTKRLEARLERTVDLFIALASALVLWFGARLVLRAALTPGDLLVFLAYLKNAFKPMKDLAKYTGRLAKAAAAGERVIEVLDHTSEVRDDARAGPAPPIRGSVRFDEIGFGYDPGHAVLKGLTLAAEPGEMVAVVGPSGSGKSTLASLLLRLYEPRSGRILVDGRDIREFTIRSMRTQIAVVPQDGLLFATSVRDNITLGLPGCTQEAVEAAARLANAHGFIEALPRGYDTVVGERGVTLSNGQRQRIAIARAAVRTTPILVLDEPTTALDEENARTVAEALERLARGRTTFLITHDLQLAARASRIAYMEDGRIRECGSHGELMLAGGRYAHAYQLQLLAGPRPDATPIDYALAG